MDQPIERSNINLIDYISNLRTGGCTALGPAALTSILLAGNHSLGSNILVCTDGAANVGLGSFNYG
jgi:hypothetical protein